MTNPLLGRPSRARMPKLPKGEPVATYETYDEAQKAVVTLAEADFPVTQVSIVGNELTSVERVTGKLTSARAAVAGAASGAWLGLFLGLVTFLFSPVPNISFVVGAVIIGVGFGAIYGIVSYSITRRRRDFTSVMQVTATSYSVVVEPDSMHRARNVLGIGGASTSVYGEPVVTAPPAAPPVSRPVGPYGERVPEPGAPDAPEPTAPPTSTDRPVGEQGAQGA
ncbi:general stress protein [Clavibacter sp. VKM Ac-2542]|uniref:general stress protein n=1 Tax=Clavibacter sp. VKM Ac-2542 TaxID=2783811 RepID=UPI00188C6DFD|nr:general stress protein [Clavibacter sp. VKM Ac-2542]MBF4620333.1 hypothetical protein [Clavibacter sp. VKM Ac-2542]